MSGPHHDAAAEARAEAADRARDAREDAAMVAEREIERLQRAKSFRHRIAVYTGEIA